MSTYQGIRHRLLTVVLLGVLTSVLSLTALVHLLSTTTAQRVERARDGVVEEVDRIAKQPNQLTEPSAAAVVGMRGGTWDGKIPPAGLPQPWLAPVRSVLDSSATAHARVVDETSVSGGRLVIAAAPSVTGSTAWSAFLVRPTPSLLTWQWIVVLLALATTLLFATAVYAIVTLNRGASALHESLKALATDLTVPIPRPPVRELSDIADRIAELAQKLVHARREEERLGRELAGQQRLAALGRVVAGVAHEVRNPLASIKLRLDLAAAGEPLPVAAENAVAHASSEIGRLDRLVADLLVVAGRAAGPKSPTLVGALLRARVEAVAPWSAERGVTVLAHGDGGATIDSDSVARAIDNLLRNAVDASPPGGRVEAHVIEGEGDIVTLRVEDGGDGVLAERVPELFEPFFTTKSDGTGLGLAISRAIARAHGGDVLYTRHGTLTRFELSLSKTSATSAPSNTPPKHAEAAE